MGTISVRYIVDYVEGAIAFYTQHLGFSVDLRPVPGDLASEVQALRNAGAHFRNDIVAGQGEKQLLLDDPAGNPLFPALYAENLAASGSHGKSHKDAAP